MAFQGDDVAPEKKTGFTHKGKEIILSKTRGRPFSGKDINGQSAEKKRIEAATIFAATGDYKLVEELTGVKKSTMQGWLKQEWCQHLLEEIRNENDQAIDAKFTEIVEKTIATITDRLNGGDFFFDRNGELVRKPVSIRDAVGAMMYAVDKRNLLRGRPTSRTETATIDQKLARLASQFESLAKKVDKTNEKVSPQSPEEAPGEEVQAIPIPSPISVPEEASNSL